MGQSAKLYQQAKAPLESYCQHGRKEGRETMPPVLVEIGPRPADAEEDEMEDEVEFVGDLDQIVESTMCSCNAGDDNPY